MATQKWCNVAGCKKFIFAKLDDFAENGWSAFQIPNGKGKVLCYCTEHQKEMQKDMGRKILQQQKGGLNSSQP